MFDECNQNYKEDVYDRLFAGESNEKLSKGISITLYKIPFKSRSTIDEITQKPSKLEMKNKAVSSNQRNSSKEKFDFSQQNHKNKKENLTPLDNLTNFSNYKSNNFIVLKEISHKNDSDPYLIKDRNKAIEVDLINTESNYVN